MSKLVRLSFALMTAFLLFEAKLDAAKPAAKPTTKTVSSKPATKPVKATQSKPTTTKATKASKPPKTTTTTTTAKAPKSATKVAKTTNPKKSTTTTASTSTTTTGGTSPTTTTTTTTTTTPVGPEMNSKLQKKLGEDSKHAARMATRLNLPAGITIQQAAAGFKNWGQFNAAVNLSASKGIPFNDLKAALTGWTLPNAEGVSTKTTTGTMSLGQAQKAFSDGTLPTYPPPSGTTTTTTTTQH